MMIRLVSRGITKSFGLAGLLVAGILGSVLAAPPPDRIVRIGFISSAMPNDWDTALDAVTDGLRDLGYIEGKNLVLVRRRVRFPDAPIRANVDELLAMNLDVLITGCGWGTSTAIKATNKTPIVMVSASDPVSRGWVHSIARPGANVTGVSGMQSTLPAKMLDHLRLTLPDAKAVGITLNARTEAHRGYFQDVEAVAAVFGIKLVPIDLNPLRTVPQTRDALRQAGVQALMMVPDDDLFWLSMDRIIEASEELRLPMTFFRSDFLEPSGLLSYGPRPHALFSRTAAYVDKIVNGARPAELPIEQPTQFEFAVNLKKAAAYGITIPRSVLLRADTIVK